MTLRPDVTIVGGGLAGLTLALQLKSALPTLDVVVVERREYPVPETTFKVGESLVEVSSWYLGTWTRYWGWEIIYGRRIYRSSDYVSS